MMQRSRECEVKMNKKAMENQIWTVVILAAVLTGVILFAYVFSLLAPLITSTSSEIKSIVVDATNKPEDANLSNSLNVGITAVDDTIQSLKWISYTYIIALFMGFLLMAYYVRTYPFLIVFWIIIIFALTFLSMILSNSYQEFATSSNDLFGNAYASFGVNDFLMRNLPQMTVMFGIVGGIFLFILASRDSEAEASS